MASKKKRGTKSRSTKKAKKARAKPKAAARAKTKAKTKAKAKAKAKTKTKAKAKPRAAARATPKARAKPEVAAKPHIARAEPELPMLDEVVEEPLLDVSGILRVKDALARSHRDIDEDELKQFPDPSLVVEAERRTEEPSGDLPELFAAEERRQKAEVSGKTPQPDHGPLFQIDSDSDSDDDDSNDN